MNDKRTLHQQSAPPQDKPSTPKLKSQAQLFLEITAISGEYPADNIHRIFSSSSYAKKKISALTTDKLLKVVNKGGVKGYRLAIGGKRELMADNPARFAGYLDGVVETNKMRVGHARRLRLHSIAQVHTIMHNADVRIFQDNKPDLFSIPPSNQSQAVGGNLSMGTSRHLPVSAPCFYSSREQKSDIDKSNAIRGSRAVGALLTPTDVYAVYNTDSAFIGWREKVEHRYKAEIRERLCRGMLSEQYAGTEISGLLIGRNLNALEQYWATEKKGGAELSFLANAYHPLYFITNDVFGETQLRLLCEAAGMKALTDTLLKGLQPPDTKYPIEHDALTEDGTPVLFCCLLDIPRLIRFHNGLSLQGKIGKIIAFDFQEEVLMRYLGERAAFMKISFEKFTAHFFPDK